MPYYHGTSRARLPSILEHGLGWTGAEQNWDCEQGVYLAEDPSVAIAVLLQHYAENGRGDPRQPSDVLDDLCVIVIDDARIIAGRLRPDEEFENAHRVWICSGTIDVTNMPVVGLDHVINDWKLRGLIPTGDEPSPPR